MDNNVGFIGLGAMGYGMAANVRKKMGPENTLYINDISIQVCEQFKDDYQQLGPIQIVSTAREAAANAATIVSIVPASKHVKDVYLNAKTGIIAARDPAKDQQNAKRIYLECSTVDVACAHEVGKALRDAHMGTYIDSPVSGGKPAADRGDLSFLLGAVKPEEQQSDISSEFAIAQRIRTVSGYMADAKKIFYCGGLGNGLAAKICNNYLSCTILLATSEAMATGIKLGLDKHVLHEVIQNSTGQSFMADHVCPVPGVVEHAPSSHNYRLGFKAQMLVKDVGLGVDAANSVGIKPSIGEAAMKVYEKVAVDERCIDRDASVVYRFLGGPED